MALRAHGAGHSLGVMALSLMALGYPISAQAVPVSVFYDPGYVDTGREGPNLRDDITGLGHAVTTFAGIAGASFTAGIGTNSILVFPEMELGNLAGDLDAAAIAVLTGFVSGGGTIIQANAFPSNASLPNALFGFALAQVGSIGSTSLDVANAAGTAFAGGPAVLPGSDAVEGISSASLPGGALNIYHDATRSSLFMTDFGAGQYIYLGFDWFEEPTPADWLEALDRSIEQAAPVPEPTTLVLLGGGLASLALRRRRKP